MPIQNQFRSNRTTLKLLPIVNTRICCHLSLFFEDGWNCQVLQLGGSSSSRAGTVAGGGNGTGGGAGGGGRTSRRACSGPPPCATARGSPAAPCGPPAAAAPARTSTRRRRGRRTCPGGFKRILATEIIFRSKHYYRVVFFNSPPEFVAIPL